MSDSVQLQAGHVFGNGRFVLRRHLGVGGMGEVWLARDEKVRQFVALKFLHADIRRDPAALEWLRAEAARSHKLNHPNIVRIHDLHLDPDGTSYIAMEYVEGQSLTNLRPTQADGVFDWTLLRPWLEQLCAALDYAHSQKVIHRDLKPANIMIDSMGRVKLADFGLAANSGDSAGRRNSQYHSTGGTLNYMSPQQVAGKKAEVANDIYALGATLYELLTSEPPFHTGNLTHQVMNENAQPIQERLASLRIQNHVPPDAAAMIMACLAKDPAQRPKSAKAVAAWIGLEMKPAQSAASAGDNDAAHVTKPAAGEFILRREPAGMGNNLTAIIAVVSCLLVLTFGGWYALTVLKGAKTTPMTIRAGLPRKPALVEAAVPAADWIQLFDGASMSGWTMPAGGNWSVGDDGEIVGVGPRSYLFSPDTYTNLEFKAEIKLSPGAIGGLMFRSEFTNGVAGGYEAHAHNGEGKMATGSLYGLKEASARVAADETWFVQHVIAIGNHIVIKVNNTIVVDYLDGENSHSYGHLALLHWVPPDNSTTSYRNLMVKPLPSDEAAAWAQARQDVPELSP